MSGASRDQACRGKVLPSLNSPKDHRAAAELRLRGWASGPRAALPSRRGYKSLFPATSREKQEEVSGQLGTL